MFLLTNHPAQARDADGQPMWDGEGKPVPLFPEQRAVRVEQDNRIVAYVDIKPNGSHHISVIAKPGAYMHNLSDEIEKFVIGELGSYGTIAKALDVKDAVNAIQMADDEDDDDE